MALGNSQLNTFECDRMDISLIISQKMRNSWNTFNYVSKNLAAWADETTIGADLRNDLIKTCEYIEELLDNTEEFNKKLDNFAALQREINKGI